LSEFDGLPERPKGEDQGPFDEVVGGRKDQAIVNLQEPSGKTRMTGRVERPGRTDPLRRHRPWRKRPRGLIE
jgi:hypothetical protein